MFENSTNTLIFSPTDEYEAGKTYYFTIVVKEENSVSVKYTYYCTLNMNGEIRTRNDTINYTDVTYAINYMNEHSKGSVHFNVPVNMTWVEENFYSMFNIFWRDTVWRDNKVDRPLH